jgi:histidine ammonia-lyase
LRSFIEIELNSANDNPIIDAEAERVLHGGHFYGGHRLRHGQPETLVSPTCSTDSSRCWWTCATTTACRATCPAPADRAMLNHGFKAVQIGTSAWTAEALKNTMPASVFSRSTECHNQDKVSMGTIAARCDPCAGADRTGRRRRPARRPGVAALPRPRRAAPAAAGTGRDARGAGQGLPPVIEDRALEGELRLCLKRIAEQHWRLHA